jgi:cytochrome c oxidase assembly factor CtaG
MSRGLALAMLTIVAAAYAGGWQRLARRSAGTVAPWRPLAAAAGLGTFAVAVASPLAVAAHERFAAHMLQHVLMMMIAVPLVLIADPFAAIMWSLPQRVRGTAGRLLVRASPLRRFAGVIVAPGVAWMLSVTVVWLWHAPALYDLALDSEGWHVVQHIAFVAAAVVFWWPVLAPAPRVRRPPTDPARLAYLVLAALANGGLGVLFASATRPFYAAYAGAPDALDDQALGGIVMWAVGSGVEMTATLLVVWRILAKSSPRALTAPGAVRDNRLV